MTDPAQPTSPARMHETAESTQGASWTGSGRGPLVVVGDSLLDVDLVGTADRLSPEAPVPVVDVAQRLNRPGGAALAALMAARSGSEVVLITALAGDEAARLLLTLLPGVEVVPIPLQGRTVCKTRVRASGQPMLRLDCGNGRAANLPLPDRAVQLLAEAGAILVSDYGRGVTAIDSLRAELAQQTRRIPVVWDPHPLGTTPVAGIALATPNAAEDAAQARADAGIAVHSTAGVQHSASDPSSAEMRCRRWHAAAVAVTAGEQGALLSQRSTGAPTRVPVPEHVAWTSPQPPDTCGAGDRFASAAAVALRNGATVLDAVRSGVEEATRYVFDGAAATLSSGGDPHALVVGEDRPAVTEAATTAADLQALAQQVRRRGGRVVATGGCFDLLHRGHLALLEHARALGDALVVCLNSDASVRRAKGADRPVMSQQDRARLLNALAVVDAVIIFDEDTPVRLLAELRPDIWVKGSDYAGRELPEESVVQRYGGQIVLVPTVPGYSTSHLVSTVRLTATQ
ncbi:MAG TPA: D-glycero-beta-D-manno-heptose 1-phosphate adenylyltransferase [Propionibacteriaceae bacterium]|nr:D-glycero-beta-D-manno-heptose 1-phosphate adenylyltransferase [Propionibacteriaceae bacterium]